MLEEYEQHFAFKLADGYSEEEIAARLGSPAELAAQFEAAPQPKRRGSVALTWLWLAWADLAYGIFAVLLIAWGAVMAACVLSFGLTAVCLIGRLDRFPPVTLPPMPYVSALLLGLGMAVSAMLAGQFEFWNDWNWFYIHNCRTYDIPIQ